ncbi:MAG TPA: hypothetical protein VK968_20955, partial [Roseimicrobium sp.]|nr:hypothetical protein [Roseimicrobium sp.]
MLLSEPAKKRPRLRLRLRPAGETAVRSGHPWVFDKSIKEQNRAGDSGELAVIYDRNNRFLAIGLFDPDSPIRVRVLHTGDPVTISSEWWNTRLTKSIDLRHGLFDAQTTGCRLINGESDGWPGLVLDQYGKVLVLKLYSAVWLPMLEELKSMISGRFPDAVTVLRLSRNIQGAAKAFHRTDGETLLGTLDADTVVFEE